MRNVQRIAAGLVFVTVWTGSMVSPAAASDVTVSVHNSWGKWVDSKNVLCAGLGEGTSRTAVAKIWPVDGTGPTFRVKDVTTGDGYRCWRRVPVPENEHYVLRIRVWPSGDLRKARFFT